MTSMLPRLEAFDLFFGEVHRLILKTVIQPSSDMKALDVGCGAGGVSILLAQALTTGMVVALDPDGHHLRNTRSLARGSNCAQRIVCSLGDVEKLHFVAGEFDLVWCSRVIHHHLPDPQLALSEMYRVLKPGGRLVLRENSGIDLRAVTPVQEADGEWWRRMNNAQLQWFQSKFRHRRPSSHEWLERMSRAGFQQAASTVLQYAPASTRAEVTYLQRWTEGILENEESPEYGDLLNQDDLGTARRLIDWCKELLHQSDDALQRLNLQISVSTEICSGSK
jgi:ubiquinone/menaquinone biosynthesis C-methylase UbiE